MSLEFYGIPNCDTVKKARKWLEDRGLGYTFHDYKKEGAAAAKLEKWIDEVGWEKVLNRAGTTFRRLPEEDRTDLDAAKAVKIMEANPSCIKRPVVEYPGGVLVGFRQGEWEAALS